MYLHYTIKCTHYSIYHILKSLVDQKQAKGDDLCEKLFCDLDTDGFWVLPYVSVLPYIIHIFSQIVIRDSPGKYVLTYISISFLWFMPGGFVPDSNTWFTEKVPVNKFLLINKQTNFQLFLEENSWKHYHHHY